MVVDGSRSSAVEIEVAGPPDAELQVTALPLGRAWPGSICPSTSRLDRTANFDCAHGSRSGTASRSGSQPCPGSRWCHRQTLIPPASAMDASTCSESPRRSGPPCFPANGELRSQPIPAAISPQTGPLVVKVIGTDAGGRRIAAWADVNASTEASGGEP